MAEKTFSQATDKEIWENLEFAELQARAVRAMGVPQDRWCCRLFGYSSEPRITFRDGTKLRVHFCPRCGREL